MSPAPARSALPRGVAALWGLAVAGLAAFAPIADRVAARLPACPVHAWTGLPCPTCGAARALLALSRGALGAALAWNPLVTIGALLFAAGGILASAAALLGCDVPEPRVLPGTVRAAIAGAFAANWIYLVAVGR